MPGPAIHHTTAPDGARIAYWTRGQGLPLIYVGVPCCSHVQLELELPLLTRWYDRLAERFRLVRLDFRGYGASQRSGVALGVDRFRLDILAVADALRLETFALFTQGGSSPAALSLAAESPRVSELVVCDGWADGPNLRAHRRFGAAQALADLDYEMFSDMVARVVLGAQEDVAPTVARFLRQSASLDDWRAFLQVQQSTDVVSALPAIRCPTLVIHSGPNPMNGRGEESLGISRAIPGAQFVGFDLPAFPLGDTDEVLASLSSFLETGQDAPASAPVKLSVREREVLALIARGKTNQQIASELVLSEATVARHVHNLLTKSGFANRTEAAAWAARAPSGQR